MGHSSGVRSTPPSLTAQPHSEPIATVVIAPSPTNRSRGGCSRAVRTPTVLSPLGFRLGPAPRAQLGRAGNAVYMSQPAAVATLNRRRTSRHHSRSGCIRTGYKPGRCGTYSPAATNNTTRHATAGRRRTAASFAVTPMVFRTLRRWMPKAPAPRDPARLTPCEPLRRRTWSATVPCGR